MNPIKELNNCHKEVLKQLDELNNSNGDSKKLEKQFIKFKKFVETSLELHTRDEEHALFPILEGKICGHACGSHGTTPIDVMMQDHKNIHAAIDVISTLLSISKSVRDKKIVNEIHNRVSFVVNTLRDHIWKEDNVLYPLAEEHLTKEEFKEVHDKMKGFRENIGFSCSH